MSATLPTRPTPPLRQTPADLTSHLRRQGGAERRTPAAAPSRSLPRTPRLRGRDAALEAVGELVAAAGGGHGAVALLVGEAGAGKSRMLDEAATIAARAGLPTLRCGAGAGDLAMLSERLPDGGSDLAPAAAAGVALPDGGSALSPVAVAGVPLLVALDDLDRANAGMLRALHALMRQLAGQPIGWLLGCREQAPAAVHELRAALVADGAVTIPLEPLSAADAAAVAAELLGAEPSPTALTLIERAEGNPLLLVALLDAQAHGAASLPRCEALLRARLDGLSTAARELVEVAAVLGASFGVEQLTALLDRSAVALLGPLHEAIDAGLLREQDERIAFRHALVRDLLHASLPAGVRGALHRQAADALLAAGAPARAVAAHLTAGARTGDRAAAATLRAAARELAESDPDRAAAHALDALRLLGVTPHSGASVAHAGALVDSLRLEAVELLTRVGRDAEAAALVEQALARVLPPEREARLRLAQARGLARAGAASAPAALATCERALERDGVGDETRARLLALRARLLSDRGESTAAAAAEEALAAARAAGCDEAERTALVDAADAAARRGAPREAAALLDAAVARLLAAAPAAAAVPLLGGVSPSLLAALTAPRPEPIAADAPLRFPSIPAGFGGATETAGLYAGATRFPNLPAGLAGASATDGTARFPDLPAGLVGASATDGTARFLDLPAGGAERDGRPADTAVAVELAIAASRRALLAAATGPLDDALSTADAALAAATDPRAARVWAAARCRLLLDAGRVAEARAAAEQLLDAGHLAEAHAAAARLHDEHGSDDDRAALDARQVLVGAALAACDRDAAQRAAAPLLGRLDDPAPRVRGAARALAARLAEADGDHGRALALLAPWFDAVRDGAPLPAGMEEPADAAWLVRLALRAGDPARAAVAARAAAPSPAPAIAAHAAALVDEHRSGLATALPALLETVALLRGGERPLARASALEDAGRALAQAGRREQAVELLDEALATAVEAGAERDAARVRSRLRALGLRRLAGAKQRPSGGWAALTEAELMVVREVAAGATNRAAAARLFLSPHTVSTHLRHAFTKLGINSRVELARMALEHDRDDAAGALVA